MQISISRNAKIKEKIYSEDYLITSFLTHFLYFNMAIVAVFQN